MTRPRLSHWLLSIFLVSAGQSIVHAGETPASLEDLDGGVIVVLANGDAQAGKVATQLGASGNSLVHVLAGSLDETNSINQAVAKAGLKGIVSVEELPLNPLPYRDHLVNALIVMDFSKAKADGFDTQEARRCIAPYGHLVYCKGGKLDKVETMPLPEGMDVWTHRYHTPDGIPVSRDTHLELPLGFKWNAGLPMNFDNPKRAANRYSSTRAMVVDDGRIFTFSEAVDENLGEGWRSEYGTDQYLTCRDAFNGRLLWRKRIGDTYYGGLYIENQAPLISTGRHLYAAGENGKMLKIDTRTGETVAELPTKHIPGFIAADEGIVVAATWDKGEKMGSVKQYDRRRMDWDISSGTVEAYDDKSGKQLWKQDLLGTSLLISEGRVIIVNRDQADSLELNHNRRDDKGNLKHPDNRVIGLDLKSGKVLWKSEAVEIGMTGETLNLEAAANGVVSVALGSRNKVSLLSATSGKSLEGEDAKKAGGDFFRYRNHICTPNFQTEDVKLVDRGGGASDGKDRIRFGGARAACLTGTTPAYGAGYIAQNWCNCTPGQVPGLLAIASIGKEPTPQEMEGSAYPVAYKSYDEKQDGVAGGSGWSTFRGNPSRNSAVATAISGEAKQTWSTNVASKTQQGSVARDWKSYLNSRLTAPVLSGGIAVVGDIDQNEIIAVNMDTGHVAWRFPTGARMDTPPTIHKGICLVGDHTGHVTALKLKTGEPLYRLRIAPEEKRMISHGKLESVWPVIGGVLVANGKAFASAGRTQGSDGGIVVRAFEPETGQPLWSRAIPQSGNGVQGGRAKLNDVLVLEGDLLRLMDHYLKADTGEFTESPAAAKAKELLVAKEKELGRQLERNEVQAIQKQVDDDVQRVSMGNEGLLSWNWTRLGYRKFQSIGFSNAKGETVSWNGDAVSSSRQNVLTLKVDGKDKNIRLPEGSQGTSLVLCDNMAIQGGSLIDQGENKGFVRAIDLKSGEIVWEKAYPSQLAFNGLAVDNGQVVAAFNDGSVVKLK